MIKIKEYVSTYKLAVMRVCDKLLGNKIVPLALIAAAAVLIYFTPQLVSLYIQRVLIMVGFYMVLSLSLSFIIGYIGEVSLGHAGFYIIGAYTVGVLAALHDWNYWLAVLVGVLLSAFFGLILAIATMRVRGTYLCMLTLAFFYLAVSVVQNWSSVTRGAAGIFSIPGPVVFGIPVTSRNGGYFYLIFFYCAINILVLYLLTNSRFGRALKAAREDRVAAVMSGISIQPYRIMAYVLGGAFAGLAGTLYAPYLGFINFTSFTFDMNMIPVIILILGGAGKIKGAVVGAFIISPLAEILRAFTGLLGALPFEILPNPEQWRFVIYGLIMVLMMHFRPQGMLGGQSKMDYRMPKLEKPKL